MEAARSRAKTAARYARFFGFAPEHAGRARVFAVPGGRFTLVDPAGLGDVLPGVSPPVLPWGAAFALACADLGAARSLLDRRGIRTTVHGERVIVPPAAACGTAILLEPVREHGAAKRPPSPRAGSGPGDARRSSTTRDSFTGSEPPVARTAGFDGTAIASLAGRP